MTMSFFVKPSQGPGASSGSLEVTDTSDNVGLGSTVSDTVTVALTVT